MDTIFKIHFEFMNIFIQLYVRIEHNLVVFSRFVHVFLVFLLLLRLELFLKCSYFGPNIEARCSYKIVLINKKECTAVTSNTVGQRGDRR